LREVSWAGLEYWIFLKFQPFSSGCETNDFVSCEEERDLSKTKAKKRAKPAARTAALVDSGVQRGSGFLPWILVGLAVAFAAAVRIRLLEIPLERDEGEFAYGGQLLLQGIPPYRLVYSMKFPGMYAAYAAVMALFGQTIAGIHVGFMLVNAATIVLVYLLGKRLYSTAAGVVAAVAYALMSLGAGVLGAQAHATHFVVIAALGGTLLLLRGIDSGRWTTLLGSGALYGIAVLMKQHGALFVAFGVAYLAWDYFDRRRDALLRGARDLAIFLGGVAAPLVMTGLALWWAGVFDKFWFWTVTYAHEYAGEVSLHGGLIMFRTYFPNAVGPNLLIWIIALAGLVLIWLRKENRNVAIFSTFFLVFSFLAVCPGLYFREHYFVLMLPAIALLAGAAVGVALKRWPGISVLTYGVFCAALVTSVAQQQEYLFQSSPLEITRAMYGANPFPEAEQIGEYIRTHAAKDATIAVLGSEPEIPFYAHRHSATGHIYMYGLMEPQPYAATMQNELIREVEDAKPEYLIVATSSASWLRRDTSPKELFVWLDENRPKEFAQQVAVADIVAADHTEYRWDDANYQVRSNSALLVYKRTDPRLTLADTLQKQGKFDEAAHEYRKVLATDPNNSEAHNNLGIVLGRKGLKEEALKEFRLSLAIKPDQALVYANIGFNLGETHHLPEAVDAYAKSLELDPNDARAHNDLGVALVQLGEYEKAAEQFDDTLRIDPNYSDAKRNLEYAQFKMKNK
jgi:Flp pilus assembly protein TadD